MIIGVLTTIVSIFVIFISAIVYTHGLRRFGQSEMWSPVTRHAEDSP